MKITCPSCAADYNVPGMLAAGRVVRCAKCGTEWEPVPAPAAELAAPEPPPLPPPEPPPPPVPAAPPPRLAPPDVPRPPRQWALLLAWIGSGAVLAAALACAVLFRSPIMSAWPPSQRVYGVLGLRAEASADTHGDVVK